jgi:hypothetical protein
MRRHSDGTARHLARIRVSHEDDLSNRALAVSLLVATVAGGAAAADGQQRMWLQFGAFLMCSFPDRPEATDDSCVASLQIPPLRITTP